MEKEQKKLWEKLMKSWDSYGPACLLYHARLYIDKFPKDPAGWIILADALGSLACYKQARKALLKAMKHSTEKELEHISHQFGHLYKKQGKYRLAESWYRKAVGIRPRTGNLVFLGACLAKQGKFEEAKQCYRQAIQVQSEIPDEAYFNLGLILRAEENYKEAWTCFNKALELDPNYGLAKQARKDLLHFFKLQMFSID